MTRLNYILYFLILCWAINGFSQIEDIKIIEIKSGLEFSEMEYNFGTIKSDSVVTHIYSFKNVSLDTIKINKVGTSWGCTGTLLSSEAIAPGETGEIKVSFRTKGRQGKQKKRITVYTNDTNHAVYRLYLQGEINTEKTSE